MAESGCVKVEVCVSGEEAKAKLLGTSGDGKDKRRTKEIEPPICIDAAICKPRSQSAKLMSTASATHARPRPYLNQDFHKIKEECIKAGKLFEDPHFKCDRSTLPAKYAEKSKFDWKRPHDFHPEPHFAAKSLSRLDIDQGNLGDCWFLASIAALSMQAPLFKRVVPLDNSFRKENNYCGIFHFRFWQYGEWVDVVVDDRLPMMRGHNKPAFLRSMTPNVFWSALLEKAYAKLCGGYEALVGGHEEEAMEDVSGGVAYNVKLRKDQKPVDNVPADLYEQMHKAIRRSSLLGAMIGHVPKVVSEEGGEQKLSNGLVAGHAYTITAVRYVHLTMPDGQKRKEGLLRIRNPWGHRKPSEWKGHWGDKSELWGYVREEERNFLKDEEDGEFWMSYEDFKLNFDGVTICYLGPDVVQDEETRDTWRQVIIRDRWEKNVNAGGQYGHTNFWNNPQYILRVPEPKRAEASASADSEGNSGPEGAKLPNVVISLMQIGRKALKAYSDIDYLAIMPLVFQKRDGHRVRVAPHEEKKYVKGREHVIQAYLPPGEYILVASTVRSNQDGDFLLRVYAEGKIDAVREESDEATAVTKSEKAPVDINAFELSPEEIRRIEDMAKKAAEAKDENEEEDENEKKTEKDEKDKKKSEKEELKKKVDALKSREASIIGYLYDKFAKKAADDQPAEMDAWALRQFLNTVWIKKMTFKFEGFSVEMCRSFIALLDVEQSGRISKEQFKKLHRRLTAFKDAFVKHDDKASGKLTATQLKDALHRAGCSVSKPIFYTTIKRYSDPDGFVSFDDFILCASRLRTAIETFDGLAKAESESALLSRDQFVQLQLYC